jgi:hypothetical protein
MSAFSIKCRHTQRYRVLLFLVAIIQRTGTAHLKIYYRKTFIILLRQRSNEARIQKSRSLLTSLFPCILNENYYNPLPLLFKALLHGQKDCVFSAGI